MVWRNSLTVIFLWLFLCVKNSVLAEDKVVLTNKISPELQTALGKNNAPYINRIKSVHHLGNDLNPDEKKAVYEFLEQKPEVNVMPILESDGIKNELVIVLMKQNEYPAELTGKLIKMYRHPALGQVWQDYCVQFLGQWGGYAQNPGELAEIIKTLQEALQDKNGGIAGTALIALNSLAGKPGVSTADIKEAAWALANNEHIPENSRIPALQIAAVMGDQRIADTARKIIAGKSPVMLKMSAMAALGMIGGSDDLALLQGYERSSDIRLRGAAVAAVRALKNRGVACHINDRFGR